MLVRLLRRIHKDQRGFTLIEVLVVMTILGILAAIVSISLLGITSNARSQAKKAEQKTVQAAFDAMLSDQGAPSGSIGGCDVSTDGHGNFSGGSYTAQMDAFPSGGGTYSAPNSGAATVLATHYLRDVKTQYTYGCTKDGDVVQK